MNLVVMRSSGSTLPLIMLFDNLCLPVCGTRMCACIETFSFNIPQESVIIKTPNQVNVVFQGLGVDPLEEKALGWKGVVEDGWVGRWRL